MHLAHERNFPMIAQRQYSRFFLDGMYLFWAFAL
jgi:hypothetical protein